MQVYLYLGVAFHMIYFINVKSTKLSHECLVWSDEKGTSPLKFPSKHDPCLTLRKISNEPIQENILQTSPVFCKLPRIRGARKTVNPEEAL